jgi:predicted nucleic acid-binding protein
MLVDTDVMIWLLRGNSAAARALEVLDEITLSDVTLIELLQGAHNKDEQKKIKILVTEYTFRLVPVSERISNRAVTLVESHALPDGLRLGDAFIAATALEHALPILTANIRHFAKISGLECKRFVP